MNPEISIIIPTLNGSNTLKELFASLKLQDLQPGEIIVGDSESEDSTVDICRRSGAKVVTIDRGMFDHGGTRSYLAKIAKGTILVYLTQDAILATKSSLSKLVGPVAENTEIGCSYGRQFPHHDATLLSAHLRGFNYPDHSVVRCYEDRFTYGLKTIFISNSFAAYKRDVLEEIGYFKNGLIFGEDTCSLGSILKVGYRVAYIADASVYHSHNYLISEDFKRSFDIGVLHSSEKWLLDTYGSAESIGGSYVKSALLEILQNKKYTLIGDWFLRCGCKFLGYKLGRNYKKIPPKVRPLLSLHRTWWQNEDTYKA